MLPDILRNQWAAAFRTSAYKMLMNLTKAPVNKIEKVRVARVRDTKYIIIGRCVSKSPAHECGRCRGHEAGLYISISCYVNASSASLAGLM